MEKYRRVEKSKRPEEAAAEPNEIRITQQGKVRNYISYANGLLSEKNERHVILKAMGNAISKAVTVAEILKHRIANLHQCTHISSMETVDVYEPLEEGLDRIETKRHIPCISIELSLDELDTSDPGYQTPLPLELVSAATAHDDREHTGPRRPRGPRKDKDNSNNNAKKSSRRNKQQLQQVVTSSGDEAAAGSSDNNAATDQAAPAKQGNSKPNKNNNRRKKQPTKDKDEKASADVSGEDSAPTKEKRGRKKPNAAQSAAETVEEEANGSKSEGDATPGDDNKKPRAHGARGGRGRGRGRGGRGGRGGGRGDKEGKRPGPKGKEATSGEEERAEEE